MVLLKRSHCSMQTPLVCPTTHFRLAVPQYSLRPHDHSGVLPPFNRTRRPCGSTPFQPRAGHDNRLFPFFPIPLRSSSGFRAPPPRPATTEDVLSAWSSHVVAGFVLLSCPARSSLSHVARFSLPFSFFISFSLSSSFILVRHARCVVSPGAPASSFGHGARHTVRVRPFAFFFSAIRRRPIVVGSLFFSVRWAGWIYSFGRSNLWFRRGVNFQSVEPFALGKRKKFTETKGGVDIQPRGGQHSATTGCCPPDQFWMNPVPPRDRSMLRGPKHNWVLGEGFPNPEALPLG